MSEELTKQTEELSLNNNDTVLSNKEEFGMKHPLNAKWILWYTKPAVGNTESWSDLLKPVISFDTVEEFWGIFNSIPSAADLPLKSDYHLFREGIKPEWEDGSNTEGGKWSFQFKDKKNTDINELWLRGLLAVIGETIEDEENEVNGIVLNIRKGFYRVGLWTKSCDESHLRPIGERFKKVLKLDENSKVDFLPHRLSEIRGAKPTIEL